MKNRIEEIKKAIEYNLPESALALSLTLPDICGQIEYPEIVMVGKRYTKWLERYFDFVSVNGIELSNCREHFVKLDAIAIYKLRCRLLHSGDAELENDVQDMDKFILKAMGTDYFVDQNGVGVICGGTAIKEKDSDGNIYNIYEIDVKLLCESLVSAAENYYDSHIPESDFNAHKVEFR